MSIKSVYRKLTRPFKPYQRRTDKLNIVLESGGKSAEWICNQFSIPVCDTSLLRLIERAELPGNEEVIALGVDDWIIKKRERYRSILVDLVTNRPIGLLGDREEDTLCSWLQKRDSLQIISRDRYINFKKACTNGAPQAIQVTDRWHLLKNLGEAMRKILDWEYSILKKVREGYSETKVAEPRVLKSMVPGAQDENVQRSKIVA